MLAEIWQGMHVDGANQEGSIEISRGDVVLKDGAIYIVESIRDGRIRATREDGVEEILTREEITLLQEDELFQILEARAKKKEEDAMKAQAEKESIVSKTGPTVAAPNEKPLPPIREGWYCLDDCGYEIAPGLKVTGLQILKARYESPLKAFVNIRLNGALTLYGFRILKGGNRPSLLPPQRQGERRYLDIVEMEELPGKRLEALVFRLAQRLGII